MALPVWISVFTMSIVIASGHARAASGTGDPSGMTGSRKLNVTVLQRISRESQSFYHTLQKSFVTVKLDPNPLHLLPQKIQNKFLVWEKNWVVQHDFRANPPTRQGRPSEPRIVIKPDMKAARSHEPVLNHSQRERLGDINHHPMAEIFLIRHYLFETHPLPPKEFWPEINLINARLNTLAPHNNNTIRGLVVGPRGYVVIPAIIAPPGDTRPVTIWNYKGHKFSAAILGEKLGLGVTVLAIKGKHRIAGIYPIRHPLVPAELLFAVNATSPSAHWVMPLGGRPVSTFRRGPRDRDNGPGFGALMGKSAAFVFTLRGRLAALNLTSGFFPLNNNRRALKSFLLTGSTQQPRFGIRFAMIKANDPLRQRMADLGNKPAMQVIGTFPHSPAARAGVKKGDIIIAIDGTSVLNFREIHRHIIANPENVVLTILRNGKNEHISMSLRFGNRRHHHPADAGKN